MTATLLVAVPLPASAVEGVLLPMLLRLEGVGAVYGAAGGVSNLADGRGTVLVGASSGDVQAAGVVLAGFPLGQQAWEISAFAAVVKKAQLITSYTRGSEPDRPVSQELAGYGAGAAISRNPGAQGITYLMGFAQTLVALEGYRTLDEREIPLPDANLHDISTTNVLLALGWRDLDAPSRPTRGVSVGTAALQQTGRAGLSDSLEFSLRASGYLPLGERVVWAAHLRQHDARAINALTGYDEEAEVAGALAADCGALGDGAERSRCEALAADLTRYIAANNRYGTASPLGGSTNLRAYREFRFRAAHTRLLATELRVRAGASLELVGFLERGYAADERAALADDPLDSLGVGLRWWFERIAVRLEAATGDEGEVWFLTAGVPW